MTFRSLWYRPLMKLSHRFHWHYAPPIYPEGDTLLWCHWCGFRQVVARASDRDGISGIGSKPPHPEPR